MSEAMIVPSRSKTAAVLPAAVSPPGGSAAGLGLRVLRPPPVLARSGAVTLGQWTSSRYVYQSISAGSKPCSAARSAGSASFSARSSRSS